MRMYVGDKDLHERRQRAMFWENVTLWTKRVLVAVGILGVMWAFTALMLLGG